MKKKTLALVLALTLLVAGVVGGTLAWLTDQTAEVKNTFTVGDINIGNEEYSGLANARTVDNGGDKDMDIICGAGEVNIEFEQ